MKTACKLLSITLAVSLIFTPRNSFSQLIPEGDPVEIRSVTMNSNNVTFVMYNYGTYTRPNTLGNVADLVWRGLGNMYEFSPLLAAEVVNDNGDTLHIVDDGLWLPGQGDYDPFTGVKWGWLPRAGYADSLQGEIATSNNPSSWPTSWASWPGEFGNGVIIGLNEAFYGMDDFTNAEFPYYPFPIDTTKRGLGVSAEVRTYQFGGNLGDAVIIKWKLKNESPRPLNKCYFGFYGDPHIGGPGDYADDLTFFVGKDGPAGDSIHYWSRNTIYVWDSDGLGDGGLPTGYMSFKFLNTPNNNDLTTFFALPFGSPNVPANDPLFYELLAIDSIAKNQTLFTTPGDLILVFGTGPFSLPPGDSTFLSLAMFFSENYQDMLEDATYIHFASHWPNIGSDIGQQGGDPNYAINLVSPNSGVVSGDVPITWQYTGTDPNAKVLIEYSWNRGTDWRLLVWEHPVSQPYTWNTTGDRDGVNYLLRIVAHSADLSSYYYDLTDQRLTVNNPVNAQPELQLHLTFEGTTVRHPPLDISWTAEDADNTSLGVTVAYAFSPDGPSTEIFNSTLQTGNYLYFWDFSQAPNAASYYLKVTASDGTSDTSLVSGVFSIDQEAGHYEQGVFQHVTGRATADFALQVVNPTQLTGHTYELTFDVPDPDSTKTMTVSDLATGIQVLSNYMVDPNISTPLFDGLKLTVVDKDADIDLSNSRFNRSALDSTVSFEWTAFPALPQIKITDDWFMAFNPLDTLPNGSYIFPGDTVVNQMLQRVVVCPFYLINIDSVTAAEYLVRENLPSNRKWDFDEPIILRPQGAVGNQASYQINFDFSSGIYPGAGDTLWVITDNPLTSADTLRFAADTNYVTGVAVGPVITQYELYHNYPNPFNPTTTLSYQIPQAGNVTLKVYDVLGREVVTLVDEHQVQGRYAVKLDGRTMASGVYFYRLQVHDFVSVKKMLLLK